jgi:hypothetical protein
MVTAIASNRVALGPRPQWVAEGGRDAGVEEMADVDQEQEAAGGATAATMSETESVRRPATDIETERKW